MSDWSCETSVVTRLPRADVWEYWTDLSHHAALEPGIEIELDGPFQTGTTGRTRQGETVHEWELADVVDGRRFGIVGYTPDRSGSLGFWWRFEDDESGTRILYRIAAEGPQVAEHAELYRAMEGRAARALVDLGARLDALAEGAGPRTS